MPSAFEPAICVSSLFQPLTMSDFRTCHLCLFVVSAVVHTGVRTPDLIRTPKLSTRRPGSYWAGGPPGNPTEMTAFFSLRFFLFRAPYDVACHFVCHYVCLCSKSTSTYATTYVFFVPGAV